MIGVRSDHSMHVLVNNRGGLREEEVLQQREWI